MCSWPVYTQPWSTQLVFHPGSPSSMVAMHSDTNPGSGKCVEPRESVRQVVSESPNATQLPSSCQDKVHHTTQSESNIYKHINRLTQGPCHPVSPRMSMGTPNLARNSMQPAWPSRLRLKQPSRSPDKESAPPHTTMASGWNTSMTCSQSLVKPQHTVMNAALPYSLHDPRNASAST